MEDTEKLAVLSDAMSDLIYGGESGWREVEFKVFVQHCRDAVRNTRNGVMEEALSIFEEISKESERLYGRGQVTAIAVDIQAWQNLGIALSQQSKE